jgi:hypothetical protein
VRGGQDRPAQAARKAPLPEGRTGHRVERSRPSGREGRPRAPRRRRVGRLGRLERQRALGDLLRPCDRLLERAQSGLRRCVRDHRGLHHGRRSKRSRRLPALPRAASRSKRPARREPEARSQCPCGQTGPTRLSMNLLVGFEGR